MNHRIRTAVIIVKDDKILLVKHVHPVTKNAWWVPPGGGLEEKDISIIESAKREVWEETGYNVEVGKDPVFIREYKNTKGNTLNLELFFRGSVLSGDLTMDNIYGNGEDEFYIKDVKWLSVKELENIVVYPEELRDDFGKSSKSIYLGRQTD